jgi:hypothetical protein
MNILASKIGALKMSPQKQNDHFLENRSNDFDSISATYGYHLSKYKEFSEELIA